MDIQSGFDRETDIPYTMLIKLESNIVKKSSVQTAVKIAKALDVSIGKLVK